MYEYVNDDGDDDEKKVPLRFGTWKRKITQKELNQTVIGLWEKYEGINEELFIF